MRGQWATALKRDRAPASSPTSELTVVLMAQCFVCSYITSHIQDEMLMTYLSGDGAGFHVHHVQVGLECFLLTAYTRARSAWPDWALEWSWHPTQIEKNKSVDQHMVPESYATGSRVPTSPHLITGVDNPSPGFLSIFYPIDLHLCGRQASSRLQHGRQWHHLPTPTTGTPAYELSINGIFQLATQRCQSAT